ncbi:MMPL family transporter [Nocardioides humilatus]|uniref:MMPL family transporter n=1 Tax=Nocardioides humilatus TaxID=2607660 RepID=A0A5B1LHR4_9ACTN|nr:MMPL family transporter [Nocardioides humilatus]KAA1420192.1 MMPL family transporter [Nocardioides humilatus]
MARMLYRLGTTAFRRWPLFIAGWLLFAVALGSIAAGFGKPMVDSFSIPGIPSEKAADLQQELFPEAGDAFDDATVNVVVAAPEGHTLAEKKYADDIADLIAAIPSLPQMSDDPAANPGLVDPNVAAANAPPAFTPLSKDGRIGTLSFSWDVETVADLKPTTVADAEKLFADHSDTNGDGFVVEANGPGMQAMSGPGGTSELIGIGVALIVLLLTFGSAIAAGMPIITAMFGVGLGMTGITAMTAFTDIGTSTPMLATMIGLAVGIDYTLFILARYRAELHHTEDRRHAAGIAVGTAGSAVVFAGLTVLIALSALAIVRIPFLTAMGLAAAATVLIAVLVALTLLPAILGMLKSWTFRGRVRRERVKRDEQGLVINNGVRWGRFIGRAPLAVVVLIVIGLGVLAVPIKDMYLAFPTDSTAPTDTTRRQASDLISEAFGPGREGPLMIVVDGRDIADDDARQAAFDDVATWAAGMDDVKDASVVVTNAPIGKDGAPEGVGTGAMIQVTPESGPDDPKTLDLLEALRDGQADIDAATGTTTGVTGLTAITTDVSDRLSGALPLYLFVVVGLAFLLLMIVFRSILVPLIATLGFLLSVLATLGATVAVFQEGALGIFEGQPIVSFMPVFLIGMVFGLAMDYQVFLVTRMREAHVHGLSTRDAVVDGFRNSARVVVAAATIMIAVFSGFMLEDDVVVKSMGFALAASIIFDAFVVRMALIPALLYLLGEKAWWLPTWLDRILPNVDVEGASLERDSIPSNAADLDSDRDDDLDKELTPAGA